MLSDLSLEDKDWLAALYEDKDWLVLLLVSSILLDWDIFNESLSNYSVLYLTLSNTY